MSSAVHSHPSQSDGPALGPEGEQGRLSVDEGGLVAEGHFFAGHGTKQPGPPTRSPRQQLIAGDVVALVITWGAPRGFPVGQRQPTQARGVRFGCRSDDALCHAPFGPLPGQGLRPALS